MAGSVLVLIPLPVLFFAGQRYFVRGIVMSGLKDQTMHAKLCNCGLLFCLLLAGAASAQADAPTPAKKADVAVSIAVPEAGRLKTRLLRLSTADPHLDVVIRNVSSKPQEFFTETCSGGYDTLHLELLSIDGKALSQPILVKREVMSWSGNVVFTVILEPGDVMVREVHFTADRNFYGIPYKNFPVMTPAEVHTIRMRAVFEVLPGEVPSKLWTGRVVSEPQDYRVEQYSP